MWCNIRTLFIPAVIFGLTVPVAQAQNADNLYDSQNRLGVSAGVKLTMPFGATTKTQQDKARLGLTLSLDQRGNNRWTGLAQNNSVNMLELGLFEDGDPNLSLMGQDIYGPLFDPLYAENNDSDQGGVKKGSSDVWLYVVGGVAVLGAATYLATKEFEDTIEDCFNQIGRNDPAC